MINLEDIHKTLLKTMDEFHEFCDKNNLNYFLLGGTLIGAVRHKGFIPWDDDFDIAMPREDYERLLLLTKNLPENISLKEFSFDRKEKVKLPFAKLSNNSMYVNEDRAVASKVPVWIDIFPLDYTFSSSIFRFIQFKIIHLLRLSLSIKYLAFNIANKSRTKILLARAVSFFLKPIPGRLLSSLLYFFSVSLGNKYSKKEKIANYSGSWLEKEVADSKIMAHKTMYEFSDRSYWSFTDADAWLSQVYGDYMKLPSIDERTPSHIL